MAYDEYDLSQELTPEDIFDMEIDQGEMEEIARSLIVPEGRYYPETPFPFKITSYEVEVVNDDGTTETIKRPVVNFYGAVLNTEGQEFKLGLKISPIPLYPVYDEGTAVNYRTPANGGKADSPTKVKEAANKLYKKVTGEYPKKFAELVEFLRVTPLRLENRVFNDQDTGELKARVVGFNLADA